MRMAFAYAAAFFVGTAFLGLTALQRRRSKDSKMANDTDANATSASLESASGAPSKLHEQATAKGDLSYSSWANGAAGVAASQAPAPRKLTEAEAAAQAEAERQRPATGASAWNHAGTFEERSVKAWAHDRLKALLVGLSSGDVMTTAVDTITGDANIWIVRGKKRHGFEFEIKLAFKGCVKGKDLKGTIAVVNAAIDDYEDDLELRPEVTAPKSDEKEAAAEAVKQAKALLPAVRQRLADFHKELLTR